jgi:hypothetical protein
MTPTTDLWRYGTSNGKDDELRPPVNTGLTGNGVVVAHERVTDQTGKYYGLNKITIQGGKSYPSKDEWIKMLPKGAVISRVVFDPDKIYRSTFYYKVVPDGRDPSPSR